MRMLGDAAVFQLLIEAVILSSIMMGAFSWKNPCTWIVALAGLALCLWIECLVYKRKPRPSRQE
jgi:hypothetical protein